MRAFLNRNVVIVGYVLVSVFVLASISAAFHSFITPVISPVNAVASTSSMDMPVVPEMHSLKEDTNDLRDPFSKIAPPVVAVVPKVVPVDTLGLKLKAIILSSKNGVVLEDANGGVYFLSEGEGTNGILVKSITKLNVTVEVNGNTFDLSMGGQK